MNSRFKSYLLWGMLAAPLLLLPAVAPLGLLTASTAHTLYLPLVLKPGATPPPPIDPPTDDPFAYVNYFRGLAGVPAVTFDGTLNDNCFQHARYMAENNHLTHDQNPELPYASEAGQVCAGNGNAWLGGAAAAPFWQPSHSIEGWMASVGHRLWLLYPTAPTFGYGFYTAADNRAGAALDVLSTANFAADEAYPHWPIRYPAPGQQGIPATQYPITLYWPYHGPAPSLTDSSLLTAAGTPIAHTAGTNLPVGHKGIVILPSVPLPANTTITASVSGAYGGTPFTHTWSFHTAPSPTSHIQSVNPPPANSHTRILATRIPATRIPAPSQTYP
jgi:hypothetical protein